MKARRRIRRSLRIFTWCSVAALLLSYASTFISPNTIGWLALFGLTYPLWFILTLLSLVFCLVSRKKLTLVPLLSLAVGWGVVTDFFAFGADNDASADDIKVMSYNVRIFDAYNWQDGAATRDSILQIIEDQQPDVLCVQEFYHTTTRKGFDLRSTISELLGADPPFLGYTHVFSDQHFYGLATFSRYPIVDGGVIEFEDQKNNLCTYVDLEIDRDTLRVYNAHLASIKFQKEDYDAVEQKSDQAVTANVLRMTNLLLGAFERRADQVDVVLEHIISNPHPTLLCGDFNDTPVSYAYNRLTSELQDAFVTNGSGVGRTYVGKFPSFRIDYFMYSDGLRSTSYHTVEKEYSDHRPIVATFSLED